MSEQQNTRKGIRWLRVVLLSIVGIVLVFPLAGFIMSARIARDGLIRDRLPVDTLPEDVGITEYETVTLTTPDDIDLVGWVMPSENGAFVILAHGHGGNRDIFLDTAQLLLERGYGVAMFDFRAHGESGGDLSTIGELEVIDLLTIVDYIATREDADPDRIGAIGFSMGGAAVAQAAAQDDRIAVVSIEASFTSLRDVLLHRADVLGPISQAATLMSARQLGMHPDEVLVADILCDISPRPIVLIHGDADTTMFPDTPEQMIDAACAPADLWVVEGLGHVRSIEVDPEGYEERVLDLFDSVLLVDS